MACYSAPPLVTNSFIAFRILPERPVPIVYEYLNSERSPAEMGRLPLIKRRVSSPPWILDLDVRLLSSFGVCRSTNHERSSRRQGSNAAEPGGAVEDSGQVKR